jgi:hypothetical protein
MTVDGIRHFWLLFVVRSLGSDTLARVGGSLNGDSDAQVPCNQVGTGRPGSGRDRQFLRRFLRIGLAKLARAAITVHVMQARG